MIIFKKDVNWKVIMENYIGPKRRQSNLEKSIDKWVVINITGNGAFSGKIKEVIGREVTLNPHKAFRYNKEKDCNLYKFVAEDSYLELSPNGYYLEPTNKETLDCYTKKQNEEILKSLKKENLKKEK
jgi:hypothetical protein